MIPFAVLTCLSASAARIAVPITVSLTVGQPAEGSLSLDVPLPSRIPRTDGVTVGADGFGLRCSGRARAATVELLFDVAAVPEHLPTELACDVGPHTVVIQLQNDREAVVTHPTVRAGGRTEAAFELHDGASTGGAAASDAPGRITNPDGQAVGGFECRIQQRMLHVTLEPGVPVGTYQCLVDGREPLVVEVVD